MADTVTANYNLTKPEVGASNNLWGGKLNNGLDLIDTAMKSISDAAKVASNLSSGTVPAARGGAGSITGVLKANGSGIVSQAVSGSDYAPATSGSSILKGNGSGGFSSAASGADYCSAPSGSSILAGNGSGGLSNVGLGNGLNYSGGTLGLGAITPGSVSTAGNVSASGDYSGGHYIANGSGGGYYRATGFGLSCDLNFQGLSATDLGFGSIIYAIANTNGVVLYQGATSWVPVSSSRRKKTNFEPIKNALKTIYAHRFELGHYKADDPKRAKRAFIFHEDAMRLFRPGAVHEPAHTAVDEKGRKRRIKVVRSVDPNAYVVLALQGIKDLIDEAADLKRRLSALEESASRGRSAKK